ncbi:hypothetical protein Tco_0731166 [Tanacetum coccineum]
MGGAHGRAYAIDGGIWYASTMPGIEETAAANWFVCLNSEKLVSKVFSLWSNPNKEPKLGRSCREKLGTVVGVGIGVFCGCVIRGMGGGESVVADKRGGSAIVKNILEDEGYAYEGSTSPLRCEFPLLPAYDSSDSDAPRHPLCNGVACERQTEPWNAQPLNSHS